MEYSVYIIRFLTHRSGNAPINGWPQDGGGGGGGQPQGTGQTIDRCIRHLSLSKFLAFCIQRNTYEDTIFWFKLKAFDFLTYSLRWVKYSR